MANARSIFAQGSLLIITVMLILFIALILMYLFGIGSSSQSSAPGSKSNPAPIKMTLTYSPYGGRHIKSSTIFRGSTLNITLLDVIKGDKADRLMEGRGKKPMGPNYDFLLAEFEIDVIKCNSNVNLPVDVLNFKATDGTGSIMYDSNPMIYYPPILNGDLGTGESTRGWVVFQYPNDSAWSPLIVFDYSTENQFALWFNTTTWAPAA